ncbi:hemerythrin domain-containing protein [Methylococcus sp. EFPC2]|uniref:hemerythrin domain-containing protein n=1 Tax=Methylococcus sp. EFPC2 TaxID=2812648 RepID=UPI0019682586|nr:hemerythrin domain-containing protein [Methylococcus sp. EFPC2]QSA95492.1 hemerythrin domain-containing protein [Methylococcus sp. EFPC2]
MSISTAMSLGEIALSSPAAARLLEAYHLNEDCDDEHTLAQACRRANRDLAEVVTALARLRQDGQDHPCVSERTLTEQAGFIAGRHHAFTRAKLPLIETLLAKVIKAHGAAHAEVKAVGECFVELSAMLEAHLLKEEQFLLPYIKALDKQACGARLSPLAGFASIDDVICQNEAEHKRLGERLKKMRELTADYALPDDVSSTFRSVYRALEELETNLMHHIFLENALLFPRVCHRDVRAGDD